MSSAAERVPTFAELYLAIEALPEGLTGEILEPGIIRTMGRPGGPHRFTTGRIPRSLGGDDAADGGRWWIEQEAEIQLLGDRLVVPDLAGWRVAGEPIPPQFVYDNPIVRVPDFCCEVLSSSTENVDRKTKVPLYAQAGVEWIWLVDPHGRSIEVFHVEENRAKAVERIDADAVRAIAPFETVVDVGRWWLPPPK